MALSTWAWGEFLVSNFQEEYQEGCMELSPDAGNPLKKLKFTDVQDIVQGTFTLTKAEYLAFLTWYKNTVKYGTIPFLYLDGRINQLRVVRIMGKPLITTNSSFFNVSMQIAFDSTIVYVDRYLQVNGSKNLLVNPDKPVIVAKKLRL